MEIKEQNPPNYAILKEIFPLRKNNLYPWGKILYNPSGIEIPADIMFHEIIHSEQQGDTPEKWWQYYASSKDFRLKQELEAYKGQLQWIKKHYPSKAHKPALEEMAENLSTMYNFNINKYQAETLIRKYNKE